MSTIASQGRVLRVAVILVALGVAVAFGAARADAVATPRIVGGTGATTPGWMTQVFIESGLSEESCGGELVSSRWVLTAAHCATNERSGAALDPAAFHLRIGVAALTEPSAADPGVAVDSVEVDPAYVGGQTTGDVALLHLAAAPNEVPIALGPAGSAAVGATPDVLGWGLTDNGNASSSLMSVAQPIVDAGGCASTYKADFVAESMICAGGVLGQDSCNGDSGGPLALSAQSPAALLLGTVDFGADHCGDGSPAVYQRVTEGSTANWLRTVLMTPVISENDVAPVAGDTETLKASSGWPDAVYAWDLNGDGVYTDAKGSSVQTKVTSAKTVSVQAISASAQDSAVTRVTLTPSPAHLTSVSVKRTGKGATVKARVPGSGSLRLTAVSGSKTLASKTIKASSARTLTGHLILSAAQRRRRPEIKLRWTLTHSSTVHATATKRLAG